MLWTTPGSITFPTLFGKSVPSVPTVIQNKLVGVIQASGTPVAIINSTALLKGDVLYELATSRLHIRVAGMIKRHTLFDFIAGQTISSQIRQVVMTRSILSPSIGLKGQSSTAEGHETIETILQR